MREQRRDELLGAALGGDLSGLTPAERAELDALLRDDPSAREELDAAREVVAALAGARLGGAGARAWDEVEPPESLHDRVLAATLGDPADRAPSHGAAVPDDSAVPDDTAAPGGAAAPAPAGPASVLPLRPRRGATARRLHPVLLAACAVLLLGAGFGGGFGLAGWLDRPEPGAPGTLGASEEVTFTGVPDGVRVSASVVAHTWGTEAVFEEISGLDVGETYRVVLVSEDGSEVEAGSFEAVAGQVDCRMTSAAMRDDVRTISVRTTEGDEVMASPLPAV